MLLLCAATVQELAGLCPQLQSQAEKLQEFSPLLLPLKGGEALACVTGVGPINAALAMGYCLTWGLAEHRPITAVLSVGLAGAFDLTATPLRSLCLVQEEIWPEYGLHDGQSVTARAFSFPQWHTPEEDIYDTLPLATPDSLPGCPASAAAHFLPCRSLTVAGVTASFARAQHLWGRYHAELENMEGFAVAYAAARAHLPCVEIRSVSNKAGPRSKEEKDFPGALKALGAVLPSLNLV